MLNERTVGQCTPDRREIRVLKIAPYFTRAGALFFTHDINNESYHSAKHDHKGE